MRLDDDTTTDDDRDVRPAVAEEAENDRQTFDLEPETAEVVARDRNAGMRRKPASNDVDEARAARARAMGGDA